LKYSEELVIENLEIANNIYKISVQGSFSAVPGQFYLLRAWDKEPVLSRPISVHEVCQDKISFIYQVVGKGTEILKKVKVGEYIQITGALGNGFPVFEAKEKIALVAGGIGVAPMLELSKKLTHCSVDLFGGFRDQSYLLESMAPYVDNIMISTENGSEGHKGYITEIFDPSKYDKVYCCGPEVMMNKVVKQCLEKNITVWVSTEKHMACGVGACLVCTCSTKNGNKRSCKDGPVFLGEDLVF